MTFAEQIIERVKVLPEELQAEILDFVEFLGSRAVKRNDERAQWSDFSLSQAVRGMDSESVSYSPDDVREPIDD